MWKQVIIDNIECNYEISNRGNLRHKNTLKLCTFHTYRKCYTCKIKIGTEIKLVRIARLVALHFLDNNDNLRFIKHVNGNVLDNHVENLKWSETSLNDGPFIKKPPTLKLCPMEDLEGEIWKTLMMDNVEWNYEISNLGRVRTKNTKKLSLLSKRGDYLGVTLQYEQKRSTYLVHRLVTFTFIPNDDDTKKCVKHKNNNPIDNNVENLEWISISDNVKHSYTKSSRKSVRKAIVRYDLNGTNAKRYDCVQDARQEFGGQITKCLKGTVANAYGYLWKYESIQPNKISLDLLDLTNYKVIDDHKNFMISNDGKVYNISRNSFLTPRKPGDGSYMSVVLDNKHHSVHILVAKHFIPNDDIQNKIVVNHKDGDKMNNCVENLEWTTQSANIQHAYDTNLRANNRAVAQYTLDNVLVATYNSSSHASKMMNLNIDVGTQIGRCCNNKKSDAQYRGFIWKFV